MQAVRRWAVLVIAGAAGCGTLPPACGPLPVRDQHPGQLLAPHLDPVPAQVLVPGAAIIRAEVAHTSLWLGGSRAGRSLALDGEITRAALDVRLGVSAGVELEVELPFGYASGGFLDSFVVGWHDFFGFADQGRDGAPRNAYRIAAEVDGTTALAVEPHEVQVMDLPLGVRVRLFGNEHAALSARALVELPTGDEDAGFGNGGVDVALGLCAEVHFGAGELFAHGHYAFVSDSAPARRAGLELHDVGAFGFGGSYRIFDWLSLHLQTQVESSVLRDLGFDRAADVQWLLWSGFRIACSDTTFLELALGEDLGPYVSPDFTLWAAMGTRWGR
jgi:hypothetical protein